MMRGTKGGAAHYLHCLPADVTDVSCAAGEVSKAVFEKARLGACREANHKPFWRPARLHGSLPPSPSRETSNPCPYPSSRRCNVPFAPSP